MRTRTRTAIATTCITLALMLFMPPALAAIIQQETYFLQGVKWTSSDVQMVTGLLYMLCVFGSIPVMVAVWGD